uniref:Retrotransposon protein, putative, unclassified n=1 Tax=Oryza sativa subsp. japonica TaxID=39947 RepID=Q2QVH8_ORYSJ|nr:retrotransposon protein, putative, unclassified [Oryza sativa Japonica Group]
MNPLKCAFGVSVGKFLRFMVHERGVEIDPKKIEKIRDFKAPTCKKEVEKLLSKVNYLRRFISNLAVDHHIDVAYEGEVCLVEVIPWKIYFDGSSCKEGQGIGVVLFSPNGMCYEASVCLEYYYTNNQAEYNALLFGLQVMEMVGVGDQRRSDRRCMAGLTGDQGRSDRPHSAGLTGDLERSDRPCVAGLTGFGQNAGGHASIDLEAELIKNSGICAQDTEEDWRIPLIQYLKDPTLKVDRKIRRQVFKYTLLDEDLYRRNIDGVLLKCLDEDQSKVAMGEVHEGICGTHQSAHKMNWLLRRAGFYWPRMIDDCFKYYRGCEACQQFGNVQLAPAAVLNPIIKPWPFRGWALDFIGQIYSSSSKGHRFVLVATDYFTKWAEAVPLKNMTHTEVIDFILKHIIHRFGIPQTLTTDQGASFMSKEVKSFTKSYGIKLLSSSPYYAQANGQAESSNKTLLKLVKKKIEEHPKRWHEVLSEALWAHRISKHGATKVTPFELVYGQEAVLPVEVNLGSLRYIKQDDLSSEDYKTLMGDNLDEVIDKRLKALEEIEKEKKRVAKAYNKRVKAKLFQVGDLVWKTISPLGTRSKEFGKWSPSWEGPYRICGIVRGNAYFRVSFGFYPELDVEEDL